MNWPIWLSTLLVPPICLMGCAGDDAAKARPPETTRTSADSPTHQNPSTLAPMFGKPTFIETRVINARRHVGVVHRTSLIGESAFCPGGKTTGGSEGAAITTTFPVPMGRSRSVIPQYSPAGSKVQRGRW